MSALQHSASGASAVSGAAAAAAADLTSYQLLRAQKERLRSRIVTNINLCCRAPDPNFVQSLRNASAEKLKDCETSTRACITSGATPVGASLTLELPPDQQQRAARLRSGLIKALYFVMNHHNAASSVACQSWVGEHDGDGFPFAESAEAAVRSARDRESKSDASVVLRAEVLLGNVKTVRELDRSTTFESLLVEGYHSVYVTSRSEFVVFHSDQWGKIEMIDFSE